jgi:hypothetical protein
MSTVTTDPAADVLEATPGLPTSPAADDAPPMFDLPPAATSGAPEPAKSSRRPRQRQPAASKRKDAAPGSTGAGATKARPPGRPSADDKLAEKLTDVYATLGMALSLVNERDGLVVLDEAEACAASMVKLSNEYPRVRALLEGAATGSALFAVLIAHGRIARRIAENHGVIPALPPAGSIAVPDGGGAPFPFDPAEFIRSRGMDPDDPATAAAMADVAKTMGFTLS